jgi:ubiquinone/menaquinone biosynthesis C-methylase UbiE
MNNKNSDEHGQSTRAIFQKQHERVAADDVALERIRKLYSAEKFQLPGGADWFKGKDCADIGCGNIGALLSQLYSWESKSAIAVDLDEEWIPSLKKSLANQGTDKDWCEMRSGSVLSLPIESNTIDFVSINGVLVHLKNMGDIIKGFNEGARICKKGGYYFTAYGPCGGLMEGVIMPAIRNHYHSSPDFKALIDNVCVESVHELIDKIVGDAKQYGNQDLDGKFLKSLFGTDFCVFLQDFIQPSWLSNECTPEVVEGLYEANGFTDVKRIGGFVKRSDIRKYFAPLHHDRDHNISKILYGSGYVQYIGKKS